MPTAVLTVPEQHLKHDVSSTEKKKDFSCYITTTVLARKGHVVTYRANVQPRPLS